MLTSVSRRIRSSVAFATVLVMAVASVPASGSAGFGDVVGGAYYESAVQWMVDNEITLGTSPGCFSPNDPVTRAQAAAFMWRMEGEPDAPDHSFSDVSAAWLNDAVSWMSTEGITLGTTPTTFSPGDPVTRGQIAAFLYRLAGEPDAPAHSFTDIVQTWQNGPVSWMADQGITTGKTAAEFAPNDVVTRAQVAAFFYRYQGEPAVVVESAAPSCGPGGGSALESDSFDGGPTDLLSGDDSVWTVYNGSAAEVIDIDSSTPGSLVIVPRQFSQNGWYSTSEGPFVYQEVDGDFAVAIRLSVLSAADSGGEAIPGAGFNSGGFVIRDPDSAYDWVMYNMGNQASGFGYGREVKTTVAGTSLLNLYSQTATTIRLLACRVGSEVHYFYGSANGTDWTEEVLSHNRPDFGETLQVGFIANAWSGGPPPWVEVEEVQFSTPTSVADCTSAVPSF